MTTIAPGRVDSDLQLFDPSVAIHLFASFVDLGNTAAAAGLDPIVNLQRAGEVVRIVARLACPENRPTVLVSYRFAGTNGRIELVPINGTNQITQEVPIGATNVQLIVVPAVRPIREATS